MPNNTDNVLRVYGPSEALASFETLCRGCSPSYPLSRVEREIGIKQEPEPVECLTFSGVCPVPDEVLAGGYDSAGYDWQRAHWGTKWDAYGPPELLKTQRGDLVYLFQTAWGPPLAWLRYCVEKFPTLHFELYARDELPYCMTVYAYTDSEGMYLEECYGQMKANEGGA